MTANENNPGSEHLPPLRIVAFLDILGFEDIVSKMETDAGLYDHYKDALNLIPKLPESMHIEFPGFPEYVEQATFSDCTVLSLERDSFINGTVAETLIIILSGLFGADLLRKGILLRGGITSGWLYHDRNILFGKGLIKTYQLEKKAARYPRIIVTDDTARRQSRWLKLDHDGLAFINLFRFLTNHNFVAPEVLQEKRLPEFESYCRDMNIIRENCERELKRKNRELSILANHRWLANQFNEEIRNLNDNDGATPIKPITL